MGEHRPVLTEIELTFDEAVGELARLNCERTDVAGHLLALLVDTTTENHLKHTAAGLALGAEDQRDQVGTERDGHR